MREVIVDTNVVLRFLLADVKDQFETSKEIIQMAKKGKLRLTIPEIVIFEVLFIFTKYYEFEKKSVVDKVKTIVMTDYIAVDSRRIFVKAIDIYVKNNLSFVDCFLKAKSIVEGKELLSVLEKR